MAVDQVDEGHEVVVLLAAARHLPDASGGHGRVRGRGCGGRIAFPLWRCVLHRQCHLPHVDLSD